MGPLLEIKFHIPGRRPGLVARPRLIERLSRGSPGGLTLVSAPAGFGKTSLLTEWLATADGWSAAWLSLDQRDNDPVLFWTYVATALQTAAAGVGATALALLRAPQPPMEAVIATVLNDVHTVPNDVVLVLDDYHVIETGDVQQGVAFLLEHLPRQLHLVIASRADPALALARLRGRGELLEVRAADLRFTPEESAAYLNGAMGLELTAPDVAALEGRTEGWIAALQRAALSMQGRDDVGAFIAGFAGDDRYIVDYLVEEVLAGQPDDVRTFLLQTSILDRLCGPLCDAVTGQPGGRTMLESLERGNLFVVPLDDNRRWYRYHHLFGDVLQAYLLDERPEEVAALHGRASEWYDQDGEPTAAVRHALAAGDVERAAGLLEIAIPMLSRTRQEAVIRSWLHAIPDEVVRARPVLAVGFIGALMASGEFEGIEGRLRDVERSLALSGDGEGAPFELVAIDKRELAKLPGAIEMYRAGLALVRGDSPAQISHAERAIAKAPEEHHLTRAGASALAGLAFWADGDLEAAHRGYTGCVEGLQRAGHIADVLGCSITLADIRITQGRLGEALRTYQQALRLAAREDDAVLRGTADMHVGMSQIACERGDLPAATRHLQRAGEVGEDRGLPQNPYRWRVAMARVREAEGDLDSALDLIEQAQQLYAGDFSPNVRPVPASRARLLVAQGRLGEALDWAGEQGLSSSDDLSYLREYEHITLARVLVAQSRTEHSEPILREAAALLERLLAATQAGQRAGSVIEILVLQALGHDARGDVPGALGPLTRALALGEPEGYVRVFVGEGPAMASLLRAVAQQRTGWDYVRRLSASSRHGGASSPVGRATPAGRALVERLSDRELDVLRLLGTDLNGPDIARALHVSLNTLRTHSRNIYAKLGVNSRRAAIHRAHDLDLLPGQRRS